MTDLAKHVVNCALLKGFFGLLKYIPIAPSKYQKLLKLRKLALGTRVMNSTSQSHNLRQIVFLAPKSLQALVPLLSIKGPHGVVPMLHWNMLGCFSLSRFRSRRDGENMKKLLFALAALSVLGTVIPAKAACPPGTTYNCTSSYNGKQSCGCP
jgi:hypothetical protein